LTSLSDLDSRGPRLAGYVGRIDDGRVFRSAVRHSRHVRLLRVAIPSAIAVVVLGAVAFSILARPLSILAKLPVDVGSLVISGSKIMMQQPRVAGYTRDNRRYVVVADAAGQDVTKPDFVELHGGNATTEMKDKDVFEITARDGTYNGKTELLTLSQNIVVTSTSGYRALLNEAVVDMRTSRVTSEQPVQVSTSAWTIEANRMDVTDSGDVMRFERGVQVTLQPQRTAPTAEARSR
jgi:lipopolysaccharide export system protein LptC